MKLKGIITAIAAFFVLVAAAAVYGQDAAKPAPDMPQKVMRVHEVKAGEDLHLIAGYYYGDTRQWKKIWQLNRKQIRNPNRINVGQMINIEVEPGWKPKFSMEQYLAQRGVPRTEGGYTVPARQTKYVYEKEEVHSTAPKLLEETGKETGTETETEQGNTEQPAPTQK